MKRLALSCAIAIGGCGDDSDTSDSFGSNSADDSVSAGTGATDTGNDSANDDSSSGSASVSGSTSADGSSGAADSGSSGGEDGSTSAAGSDSGGDETFACGDALMCLVASEYCQETVGGAQGSPPQYQCMDLPPGCQPDPSCECLTDTGCGNMCQMSGAGLQVTCQAP